MFTAETRFFLRLEMSKTTIKSDKLTGMAEAEERGGGALSPPKILEDQLTLSQPGGRLCPPIFSDLAPSLN